MSSLSGFLRLSSSPLFSYESALVWPCLGITSLERNANRIRSIPTQLPPNSAFFTAPLCCRVTWSFPRTRHDLWLRFGGWRCVCAALLFQASGAACAAVLRIQEEFIQRGCSSERKVDLIASQRKSPWIPLKMAGRNFSAYSSWRNFEEGAS